MITLYQISAKHLKTDLENEAYNEALLFGFPSKGLVMELYKKVAVIDTEDMEEAFALANLPEESIWSGFVPGTVSPNLRSMSVGDIISNSKGEFYICQDLGFRQIKCQLKTYKENKTVLTLSNPWAEIVHETSRKTGFKSNRIKRNIKHFFNVQKLKIRKKIWNS